MRSKWINAWRNGALMIVAAVALWNVVHGARSVLPPPVESPAWSGDPVTRQEGRLGRLREAIRARGLKGTVGYVDDLPVGRMGEAEFGVQDYYLAQFVLVPLVLDPEPEPHEWAVANLRTSSWATRGLERWSLVEDCGAGVLLLRKTPRR
jgi:hypothetical protein